jgi:hypothetical protein
VRRKPRSTGAGCKIQFAGFGGVQTRKDIYPPCQTPAIKTLPSLSSVAVDLTPRSHGVPLGYTRRF